jgi:membrane-bound lytic murein transglycosylase D
MKFFESLILIVFGIFSSLAVRAQSPEVPHKMQFADITLSIRDDARREIQKDVDAMTLSPKHFNIKAERAKTYFPIIEKVFAEENVPDDFKYLVLQESALIADAVSPSNAVGFWQFKDFTAIEMGLRVDKEIDERMNIVSASRGAAKYFKKNNMFFDNWLYALQAYQMGAGAVMQLVKDNEHSIKHMEVTSKTYWYVKKFLAHKIAFENAVKGPGQVQITTFESKGKRSVAELAKEISVEEAVLKSNNKWIKKDVIPDDRTYAVLIPVSGNINDIKVLSSLPATVASNTRIVAPNAGIAAKTNKINGLPVIIAKWTSGYYSDSW